MDWIHARHSCAAVRSLLAYLCQMPTDGWLRGRSQFTAPGPGWTFRPLETHVGRPGTFESGWAGSRLRNHQETSAAPLSPHSPLSCVGSSPPDCAGNRKPKRAKFVPPSVPNRLKLNIQGNSRKFKDFPCCNRLKE